MAGNVQNPCFFSVFSISIKRSTFGFIFFDGCVFIQFIQMKPTRTHFVDILLNFYKSNFCCVFSVLERISWDMDRQVAWDETTKLIGWYCSTMEHFKEARKLILNSVFPVLQKILNIYCSVYSECCPPAAKNKQKKTNLKTKEEFMLVLLNYD